MAELLRKAKKKIKEVKNIKLFYEVMRNEKLLKLKIKLWKKIYIKKRLKYYTYRETKCRRRLVKV